VGGGGGGVDAATVRPSYVPAHLYTPFFFFFLILHIICWQFFTSYNSHFAFGPAQDA